MERRKLFDPWVWTIITILLGFIGFYLGFRNGFEPVGVVIWVFLEVVTSYFAFLTSEQEVEVELKEFIIYEFELWDDKKDCYEKKYIIRENWIVDKYRFHWKIKTYERQPSYKELIKDFQRFLDGDYFSFTIYSTKEEYMKGIYLKLSAYIAKGKEVQKVVFRNIMLAETLTLDQAQKLKEKENLEKK